MADDVVPDRLAEIKARSEWGYEDDDRAWLIAEVERLRGANEKLSVILSGEPVWREMWSEYCALKEQNGDLLDALQALVDATEEDWATIVRARAVAVAVLTGQATELTGENLRDSGVGQAGGVSDGPQ